MKTKYKLAIAGLAIFASASAIITANTVNIYAEEYQSAEINNILQDALPYEEPEAERNVFEVEERYFVENAGRGAQEMGVAGENSRITTDNNENSAQGTGTNTNDKGTNSGTSKKEQPSFGIHSVDDFVEALGADNVTVQNNTITLKNNVQPAKPLILFEGTYILNLENFEIKGGDDFDWLFSIHKASNLTINSGANGKITATNAGYYIYGGKLTITGGSHSAEMLFQRLTSNGDAANTDPVGQLNIQNGNFHSEKSLYFSQYDVNIQDGNFTGGQKSVLIFALRAEKNKYQHDTTITINGGNFQAKDNHAIYWGNMGSPANCNLVINGGTFTNTDGSTVYWKQGNPGKFSISGGKFTQKSNNANTFALEYSDSLKNFHMNSILTPGKKFSNGRQILKTDPDGTKLWALKTYEVSIIDGVDESWPPLDLTLDKTEETKNPNTADSNGANGALISVGAGVTGALGLVAAVWLRRRRA